LESRLRETKHALEEIGKAKANAPIYKSVGPVLIKSEGKESVIKELLEGRETLEIRVKTLEKQEGHLKEQASILECKLRNALALAKGQKSAQ
jgi:prefoldin beta subunit